MSERCEISIFVLRCNASQFLIAKFDVVSIHFVHIRQFVSVIFERNFGERRISEAVHVQLRWALMVPTGLNATGFGNSCSDFVSRPTAAFIHFLFGGKKIIPIFLRVLFPTFLK